MRSQAFNSEADQLTDAQDTDTASPRYPGWEIELSIWDQDSLNNATDACIRDGGGPSAGFTLMILISHSS